MDNLDVLCPVKLALITGDVANGPVLLKRLGFLVSDTSTDLASRKAVSESSQAIEALVDIITEAFNEETQDLTTYIRLFRGALMVTRNVAAERADAIDVPLLLLSIQHFTTKVSQLHQFFVPTLEVFIQLLANLTHWFGGSGDGMVEMVETTFLSGDVRRLVGTDPLVHPMVIFLNQICQSLVVVGDMLERMSVMSFLSEQFEARVLREDDLSPLAEVLVQIHQKLVAHEAYRNWIFAQTEGIDTILRTNQLVVTEKEDWDNYQLTAILAWVYDFVKTYGDSTKQLLLQKTFDEALAKIHKRLVVVLDILSDLSKFNATKQFLEHYEGLEVLLALLRVVHENTQRKVMKKKENTRALPHVKSLIIEIIAHLVYQSFDNQEKVRELGGLELVLSNCMIDENDPFIKERSIVCVKFLLENNPKNQEFVAQLEAKKTVDDLALREVGYEVQIDDGKVNLKKSETIPSPTRPQ